MKIKKICRLCVDAAMLAVTVLLMASKRTGIMLYILLGVVLFVLLVIHNTLNASWWGSVNANRKMSFFAGMECHLLAVSMRWVCSLDYPLLVGLKPVKS